MSSSPRHFRIFLSSPGDVANERLLALQVIDQLPFDPVLRDRVTLESVAWDKPGEDTPLLANMTPQDAILEGLAKPSDCDLVIVIFWSRMGTPLPPEYVKPDGSRFLSGTEWEYWDAVNAAKASGKPLILVYRRTEKILLDDESPDFVDQLEQRRRLKTFLDTFVDSDGTSRVGINYYASPEEFRARLETHLRSLIKRLLDTFSIDDAAANTAPSALSNTLWIGSPFPGLRALTPDDAPIFFGRGREVDALIKRVQQHRFVSIIGASGSGKSSLIGAGLIPRLRSNAIEGSKDWLWIRFTPGGMGENPFLALAAQLGKLVLDTAAFALEAVAQELHESPQHIRPLIEDVLRHAPLWAELVIFIDQFEEVFTLVAGTYRQSFVNLLYEIAHFNRARIVSTMRSDFYPRCVDVQLLTELLQEGSYPLSIPGSLALYMMITRPAERAGLVFEEGLPEQIVNDTGSDPGALALMAYTLDELYNIADHRGDRKIISADYEQLGGVQGAIGQRAEKTLLELPEDAQAALTHVFRELIEVDENGTATRRRASFKSAAQSPAAERFIKAFTNARLLTSDKLGNEATIEVSHEALLRNWDRIVKWISEAQQELRAYKQVRELIYISLNSWRQGLLMSRALLERLYQMREQLVMLSDDEYTCILFSSAEAQFQVKYWMTREPQRVLDITKREALSRSDTKLTRRLIAGLQYLEKDAVPLLTELQDHPNPELKRVAQRVLERVNTVNVIAALNHKNKQPEAEQGRPLTLLVASSLSSELATYTAYLNSTDSGVRHKAFAALLSEARRGMDALVAHVKPHLQSKDKTVVQYAESILRKVQTVSALQALKESGFDVLLNEAVPPTVTEAQVRTPPLRLFHTPEQLPDLSDDALLKLLESDFYDRRERGIVLIWKKGTEAGVSIALRALRSPKAETRRSAVELLRAFSHTNAESYISVLYDDSPYVRGAAAKALGELRLSEAVPVLIDRLYDEANIVKLGAPVFVSDIAAKALLNIGTPEALAAVERWKVNRKPRQ